MRAKTKIQLIEKEITDKYSLVRISEELDQNYKKLTGIAVLHTAGEHNYFVSFTVGGIEVFPKNFEVAFLQTNAHVAPKDRFFPLQLPADGQRVDIEFQEVAIEETQIANVPEISYSNSSDLSDTEPVDVTVGIPFSVDNYSSINYPYTLKIYLQLSNE